ncbi:ABC transporter ATP-binding protein [Candidatus Sumerlaeota bacterium]|nr:ABC transporter ATP-binding protein [Candidatus Sumerlaeota bacterium]
MAHIECRGLSCKFGDVHALGGVELRIEERSWTTLAGPSGSGKTTLLRAIAGLESASSGEIHIGGTLATNRHLVLAPHERRIGFVFQEPSLWPHLTAAENVALGIPQSVANRRERAGQAREWMETLGIGQYAAQYPGTLSAGESQRVAIARALAANPRILLLDEPTSHLDLHLREEWMRLLKRLHTERELTTLCVMHQLEPPLAPDDRIVILEQGKITHDGTFASLREAVESPFTSALRRMIARVNHWA